MNPFASIFNAYVRWRHSRGFGVHSPFAYRLVRMAVRPGADYGYYGYADIDHMMLAPGFKGYPQARSDARLLLRLLVQLGTRRLFLPEGLPAMLAAARAASVPVFTYTAEGTAAGHTLPSPAEADLLVATPAGLSTALLASRLVDGTALLLLNPSDSCMEAIYKACGEHGLILHGTRLLLAVPRPEMAFTAYTMKF